MTYCVSGMQTGDEKRKLKVEQKIMLVFSLTWRRRSIVWADLVQVSAAWKPSCSCPCTTYRWCPSTDTVQLPAPVFYNNNAQ